MRLLTRAEELILLAVQQLGEEAYCLPIRERISKITGDEWSLGSIYMPLDRLVKLRFLDSYLSEAIPERGGRHKRIYQLTQEGRKALIKVREVQNTMWSITPGLSTEI
jgi:DNA-binding PadR family transcriptional regulator